MAEADTVTNHNNGTLPRRPGGDDHDDSSLPDLFQIDDGEHQQHRRRTAIISRRESTASRPREATELGDVVNVSSPSTASTASISSGEYRATPRETVREAGASSATVAATAAIADSTVKRGIQALKRFWGRHVTLIVPQQGNRDYFALERTFLAYMRTAVTFSMQGVLVAQIFRLRTTGHRASHIDFHSVGIPLSIAYQTCAIIVALLGAHRFWRQQNAIARGKILSGGWELQWIGMLTLLAGITLFALAVAIIVVAD